MGCAAADDGQFPWQVSLQGRVRQRKQLVWYGLNQLRAPLSPIKVGTSHFCGGSVISATKVASAAHCFQNSFNVVAGSVDNQGGQTRVGDHFLQHPAYDSQNILNDFAVVTTASGFNFNDYLQPIPLVAPSNNRTGSFLRFESFLSDSDCLWRILNRPAEGTQLFTSGFGYFQKGPLGRPVREVSRYLLFTETFYVSGLEKSMWKCRCHLHYFSRYLSINLDWSNHQRLNRLRW